MNVQIPRTDSHTAFGGRLLRTTLLGAAGAMLSAVVIGREVSHAFDRSMVGTALDRQPPKLLQRLEERLKGEGPEDGAVLEHCIRLQHRLENTPHQLVELCSFDGTPLVGHLFRAEHQKRVVLAMHGWRSCWARDFGAVADFLRDNGCTVLYGEQRGQGESGGAYMGFGMIERYDCLEWVRWLNANGFRQVPVYLAGISMGATTVLMAAGFDVLPENVAGVIADCGFTSAGAEWKYISENNLRISFERRRRHVDALCRKRIELNADAYSTLDAMKACRVPILFIHGAADTFVPVEMTLQNYEACQAPKRKLIVPGANHGMSYFYDRPGYEAAVLDFFEAQENPGKPLAKPAPI